MIGINRLIEAVVEVDLICSLRSLCFQILKDSRAFVSFAVVVLLDTGFEVRMEVPC